MGKVKAIRTVTGVANKKKPRAKTAKQVKNGLGFETSLLKISLKQMVNVDVDGGNHMAKVIAITGDLSNQHNSLGDQSGSLANLTVKFHLDEAGNVQVKFVIILNISDSLK